MIGRPSTFTQEIADEICRRLGEGDSLREICEAEGMPAASTVCGWAITNKAFSEQYARAREVQAETLADEIVQLADDCTDPIKARLQIEARKWVASKLKPKRYGDKIDHTLGSDPERPMVSKIVREIVRPKPPNG